MYSDTLDPLFDSKFQVSFNSNSHKRLKMRQLKASNLFFVTTVELKERNVGVPRLSRRAQHTKVRQQT